MFKKVTILFIFLIALHACKSAKSLLDEPKATDSIKILSVTPNSGLVDGQSTNFTVTVSYNLVSQQTGALGIAFNNTDPLASYPISSAEKIISSGSGQYTFNVTSTVKNWKNQGDFYVIVFLSNNHTISFTSLATDTHIFIPKINDTVKIISVTPSTGLNDGQSTNFTVIINYSLVSITTAALTIWFNNVDAYNTFEMPDSFEDSIKIISKGSGQATFQVNTTVKNWGTQADFGLMVTLSKNLESASLAWDTFILISKQ